MYYNRGTTEVSFICCAVNVSSICTNNFINSGIYIFNTFSKGSLYTAGISRSILSSIWDWNLSLNRKDIIFQIAPPKEYKGVESSETAVHAFGPPPNRTLRKFCTQMISILLYHAMPKILHLPCSLTFQEDGAHSHWPIYGRQYLYTKLLKG